MNVSPAAQCGSLWPPPRPVRPALAVARRRYHALPLASRPALADPVSYCGLFTLPDLLTLAGSACWPLSPEALTWIAEPPRARARRRRRRAERVTALVSDVLVAELPAAVAYLVGRTTP
jgi:hypothetical protein